MILNRMYRPVFVATLYLFCSAADAQERRFAGAVSSATPEATAAGVAILEQGGNAIDAAVAVSLALGVTEPAGSGIAGQTVMLVQPHNGEPFVIQGTTWSPRNIPAGATTEQLAYGHTASTVPSTLRVLDLAHRRFGSGAVTWSQLVAPAARLAREGFLVGPFRAHAFRFYAPDLARQPAAAGIFLAPDGLPWQAGEVVKQPQLAATLDRIAEAGAMDFYDGKIAAAIVADMEANGGWIRAEDLRGFPEPRIVPPLQGSYRGHDIVTLPPPFAGWVVLQILNVLELMPAESLASDDTTRRLALIDAMYVGHESRRSEPVENYQDYESTVERRISKDHARQLLDAYRAGPGGETTHFTVVDGNGTAVAVTQSIDSYFGARVAHPELGFLYNNYMQGFQVDDAQGQYFLEQRQMPKSSMSATIVLRDGRPVLALGSPGSARIISAVAQVTSYWVDVAPDIVAANAAFRVHVTPPDRVYVEGEELDATLLSGLGDRGLRLRRPAYGVSDSQLDPYFGGVHALAMENGSWTGAADPRRDGLVGFAWRRGE